MQPAEAVRAGLVAHYLEQIPTFVRHDSPRYPRTPEPATIWNVPLVILARGSDCRTPRS